MNGWRLAVGVLGGTAALSLVSAASAQTCVRWANFPEMIAAVPPPALSGSVEAFTVYQGRLVAGGWFTSIAGNGSGPASASRIAWWDPAANSGAGAWRNLAGGVNAAVFALEVHQGELYVGGYFSKANGVQSRRIARWVGPLDSGQWQQFTFDLNGDWVQALKSYGSVIVAGGWFTTAHGPSGLEVWDGTSWSLLGGGLFNDEVMALETVPGAGGLDLVAGGQFTMLSGAAMPAIARYSAGSGANGTWGPMGPGFNDRVRALVMFNGQLHAAGDFTASGTTPLNGIARWDAASGAWQALGQGVRDNPAGGPAKVYALRVMGSELVAVGAFTQVGTVQAGGVAAWDGVSWRALGAGLATGSTIVGPQGHDAIAFEGRLVVGGPFIEVASPAMPAAYIASYGCVCPANCDGSLTSPMLTPADFTCFLGKYRSGDAAADCDGAGGLTPADFVCFLSRYRAGCQ